MQLKRTSILTVALLFLVVVFSGCRGGSLPSASLESEVVSSSGENASSSESLPEYDNHLFDHAKADDSSLVIGRYDGRTMAVFEVSWFAKKGNKGIIRWLSSHSAEKTDQPLDTEKTIYTLGFSDSESSYTDRTRYMVFSDGLMMDSLDGQVYRFQADLEELIRTDYSEKGVYLRTFRDFLSYNRALYPLQLTGGVWQSRFLSNVLEVKRNEEVLCEMKETEGEKLSLTIENTGAQEYISYDRFSLQVLLNKMWFTVPTRPDVVRFTGDLQAFLPVKYDLVHLEPGEKVVYEYDLSENYEGLPPGEYRISFGDAVCEFTIREKK